MSASDSHKKRKHRHHDESSPSKRRHVSDANTNSRTGHDIELKFHDNDGNRPFVVSAPGLELPKNISFSGFRKKTKDGRTASTAADSRDFILKSGGDLNIDYTATAPAEGSADSMFDYYVGEFDPEEKTLQIFPVRHMIATASVKNEAEQEEPSNEMKSNINARNVLGEAFGTKKAQKLLKSRAENAILSSGAAVVKEDGGIELDDEASAVLHVMARDMGKVKTQEDLAAEALAAKPIPKPNMTADRPQDVYPASVLIGKYIMRDLDITDWQNAVAEDQDITSSSRFLAARIIALVRSGDETRIKAMKHLYNLIRWYKALEEKGRDSKKVPRKDTLAKKLGDVNEAMLDNIKHKFAKENILGKWDINYLLTHICALSLLVDNFNTDVHDIMKDLSLTIRPITQYFKELGCRVGAASDALVQERNLSKAQAAEHKTARLKLPLEFPKARAAGAGKKK